MRISFERLKKGRPAKSLLVLSSEIVNLDEIRKDAEASGIRTVQIGPSEFLMYQLTKLEEPCAGHSNLEIRLTEVIEQAGRRAMAEQTVFAIFADELGATYDEELAALLQAPHRAAQTQLSVILVASGQPDLRRRIGSSKAYAERMFDILTPPAPEH